MVSTGSGVVFDEGRFSSTRCGFFETGRRVFEIRRVVSKARCVALGGRCGIVTSRRVIFGSRSRFVG
jgi:hypothetical protein